MSADTIEFWYDFASTYSYLSAGRIEALAKAKNVDITWHPFLLGPIFQAQGWNNSPFNIYKAKGDYMWRDMARCADKYGLPFVGRKEAFPMNGLLAARITLCFDGEPARAEFTKHVFHAEFGQGKDIANADVISEILIQCGRDCDEIFALAKTPEIKQKLFANTEEAKAKGIFGAPSFVTSDRELFWGDDRLEQALDWCLK